MLSKIFIYDLPEYLEDTTNPIILNDKVVHCLLHVDDVILLSQTAAGLQSKSNKSQLFWNDWCLEVKIAKTYVLIFNTAGCF